MIKQRNKLSQKSINKIEARYDKKVEEFKLLSIEELKEKTKEKMSQTDRSALYYVYFEKNKTTELKNLESNGSD